MRRVSCLLLLVLALTPWRGHAAVVRPFPSGFLWGTAISGFQSDMGVGAPNDPNTDWWVWVRDAQNITTGRVSGELPEHGPGFWRLYGRDARLARFGLRNNALRMGIEWSRIFPTSTAGVDTSGGFTPAVLAALDALADPSAVAHYRDVLATLRALSLEPMVTLNHFTLPSWIHDPIEVRDAFVGVDPFTGAVPGGIVRGGWLDPGIVGEFEKLAAYAAWKFGDLVDLWATLNEPIVVLVNGYLNAAGVGGNFPPGVFNMPAVVAAIPQLVAAHAVAYDALHLLDTVDANGDSVAVAAGCVQNLVEFAPADAGNPLDVSGTAHADYLYNQALVTALTTGFFDANLDGDTSDPGEFRPDLAGRSDWIGVNYYLRARVAGLPAPLSPLLPLFDFLPTITYANPENPGGPPCPTTCTEFGWEIYPEGLRARLTAVAAFGLPVYVTENGIADANDDQRGQYLYDHLAVVQDVAAQGIADLRGYFQWSLTDNFEWSSGYFPRFGLYRYDAVSGRRRARKSSKVFRTMARRNGITDRLIARYEP